MISVIIPFYDRPEELKKCLAGLLKQEGVEIEIIIVNDGALCPADDIINEFSKRFQEKSISFKYLKREHQGAPAARNAGFEEARGEYLFFCDADAVLLPDALKTLLKTLEANPTAGYAYSSFFWGRKFFRAGEWSEDKLRQGPFIHTMSLVRQIAFPLSGWDETIKKFQDWDLWLTILKNGHKGVWVGRPLFNVSPGGVFSRWLPSFAYKFFPFLPTVKKYNQAREIIKKKHGL